VKVTSQLVLNIQIAYAFETTSYRSVLVSHADKVKNDKIKKERHLYEGTKITGKSTAFITVTMCHVIETCVHSENFGKFLSSYRLMALRFKRY